MSQAAKFGGTCPLCDKFIKKNVSRIERLSTERMHPDWWVPEDAHPGQTSGHWLHPPTRYVHEACYRKFIAAIKRGEQP